MKFRKVAIALFLLTGFVRADDLVTYLDLKEMSYNLLQEIKELKLNGSAQNKEALKTLNSSVIELNKRFDKLIIEMDSLKKKMNNSSKVSKDSQKEISYTISSRLKTLINE